jgi:hypothetical protein
MVDVGLKSGATVILFSGRVADGPLRRVNQGAQGSIGYEGCGEISLCAGRRFRGSESGRKSRPAPFGMTGWDWVVQDTQASRPGLNCDAPPALESGWRDEPAVAGRLAATNDGRDSSLAQKARGDGASVLSSRLSP